jgi:hypothetical protein
MTPECPVIETPLYISRHPLFVSEHLAGNIVKVQPVLQINFLFLSRCVMLYRNISKDIHKLFVRTVMTLKVVTQIAVTLK